MRKYMDLLTFFDITINSILSYEIHVWLIIFHNWSIIEIAVDNDILFDVTEYLSFIFKIRLW